MNNYPAIGEISGFPRLRRGKPVLPTKNYLVHKQWKIDLKYKKPAV
jgi:hypothetical protein